MIDTGDARIRVLEQKALLTLNSKKQGWVWYHGFNGCEGFCKRYRSREARTQTEGLVETVEMTLQDPFAHWGGCSAGLCTIDANSSRTAGFVRERRSLGRAYSRIRRGAGRRSNTASRIKLWLRKEVI